MKKTTMRKYARLLARKGVNVQKGQEVFITAELDQPEFVRMLTEECYRAGAARVVVDWSDSALTRLHIRHRSRKVLSELTSYELEKWKYQADKLPCRIYLVSEDPDALAGVDVRKLAQSQQAKMKVTPWKTAISGVLPPSPARRGQKSCSPTSPAVPPSSACGRQFSGVPAPTARTPWRRGTHTTRRLPSAVNT